MLSRKLENVVGDSYGVLIKGNHVTTLCRNTN